MRRTHRHEACAGPKSSPRDTGPQAGFTLIEVVIALAILALSLSVIFRVISDGIWQMRQADTGAQADLLVQSVLAKVGTEVAVRPGETSGQFPGGFAWRLQLQRFGDAADRPRWPLSAYLATAEVSWNDAAERRSVVERTLRLGPKAATR